MRLVLLFGATMLCAAGHAGEPHECDLLAAHPSDPGRVGPGKGSVDVVTHRAIAACRAAIAEHPDVARFHYQLGRALVYEADANDGDIGEGVEHLQHAADMDYAQAMFVLGLMHRRAGDTCSSEPPTRRAADKGLKAARISYVNAFLAGDYSGCGASASHDAMSSYLQDATTQVDGYYESMLLDVLKRDLLAIGSPENR